MFSFNEFWSPDCVEFLELASISIKVLDTFQTSAVFSGLIKKPRHPRCPALHRRKPVALDLSASRRGKDLLLSFPSS